MNNLSNENSVNEGLIDRIVDKIVGKTASATTVARNLKAFLKGDKDAIRDPAQIADLKKFEQNIRRMIDKMGELQAELAQDLVAAIGNPNEGPLKGVVDEFDNAANEMIQALLGIEQKFNKINDMLPQPKEKKQKKSKNKKLDKTDDEVSNEDDDLSPSDRYLKSKGYGTADQDFKNPDHDREKEESNVSGGDESELKVTSSQQKSDDWDGDSWDLGAWDSGDEYEIGELELPSLDSLDSSESDSQDSVEPNEPTFVAAIDDAWGEYISTEGKTFYWNSDTGEATWDHPDDVTPTGGPEHESYWDEAEQGENEPHQGSEFFDDELVSESTIKTLSKWQKIIS